VKILDLRSDTVTRPTAAMRRAMAEAEVGDDVYFEDPTVNRLQERAAARLGKEAALFVPSGTMGNQACLRTLTRPGDVVLAGEGAHVLLYEQGGAAALAGLQIETLGTGGLFDADDVAAAIHPDEQHLARTTLVTVENTHNTGGGRVFPLEAIRAIARTARDRGLALHLDGARLFNAEVATGVPAADWAAEFDTVTFCLSKGLGAPVGSVVCASAERIREIHRARKLLGVSVGRCQESDGSLGSFVAPRIELSREENARDLTGRVGLQSFAPFVGPEVQVGPVPPNAVVLVRHGNVEPLLERFVNRLAVVSADIVAVRRFLRRHADVAVAMRRREFAAHAVEVAPDMPVSLPDRVFLAIPCEFVGIHQRPRRDGEPRASTVVAAISALSGRRHRLGVGADIRR